MLSIRESINELERIQELQVATLDCYLSAIQAMAKYPVDFDTGVTESFRNDLSSLSSGLRQAAEPSNLLASRRALQDELKDYQDKATAFLNGLREELSDKAHALDLIVDNLMNADLGREVRLRESLAALRKLSKSSEGTAMGPTLLEISEQLERSIEHMKQQMKLTIGQLRVEIKMLHQQVESLQKNADSAESGHLDGRLEMEARISEQTRLQRAFSLLSLKIRNLPQIERQFGAQARADAVSRLAGEVAKILPADARIGRWNEDQFIAVLEIERSQAVALTKRIVQRMAEEPRNDEGRTSRRPPVQLSTAVLVSSPGDTYETLIRKIDYFL